MTETNLTENTDTANVDDDVVATTETEDGLKEYEVRAAGCRYFVKELVRGPDGKALENEKGNDLYTMHAEFANKGAVIRLPDYAAAQLLKDEVIQEVGAALIPGIHEGATQFATPFGVPIRQEGDDTPVQWVGPVMGDPRPAGPGTSDTDLTTGARGGAFTPEQMEELLAAQRKLEGVGDSTRTQPSLSEDGQSAYDTYMELEKADLEDLVAEKELEVTRQDGKSGDPLKSDLAYALAKADDEGDED